MHAKTTSVAINFELVCLINRTCNFRPRRTQNLVKHLRWSFFVKIVNGFKPLIMFTKSSILTKSWTRLCRSSHLRGVLGNRCSEICSQNIWKIPMKKFIFRSSCLWKLCFSPVSFFGKNFWEQDWATLLKMNFFKDIFQEFWLKISPGNFQNSCL